MRHALRERNNAIPGMRNSHSRTRAVRAAYKYAPCRGAAGEPIPRAATAMKWGSVAHAELTGTSRSARKGILILFVT